MAGIAKYNQLNQYFEDHRLETLFQDICTDLVESAPEDPLRFIIEWCDRKKRDADPEWSLKGLEEDGSSRTTLDTILKTNGEILAKDCAKIWHDYDADNSGFLEISEVTKLVNDITEVFFENNWETWKDEVMIHSHTWYY